MQLWQDNIQLRLSWALHMRGLRGNNCPPELLTGWGARRELQLMRAKTPLPPPPLTAVMCSSLLNSVLSCIYSYWSTQAFVLCNCVIIIVFLVFLLAASAQTTCHMCDLVMFDPPVADQSWSVKTTTASKLLKKKNSKVGWAMTCPTLPLTGLCSRLPLGGLVRFRHDEWDGHAVSLVMQMNAAPRPFAPGNHAAVVTLSLKQMTPLGATAPRPSAVSLLNQRCFMWVQMCRRFQIVTQI